MTTKPKYNKEIVASDASSIINLEKLENGFAYLSKLFEQVHKALIIDDAENMALKNLLMRVKKDKEKN